MLLSEDETINEPMDTDANAGTSGTQNSPPNPQSLSLKRPINLTVDPDDINLEIPFAKRARYQLDGGQKTNVLMFITHDFLVLYAKWNLTSHFNNLSVGSQIGNILFLALSVLRQRNKGKYKELEAKTKLKGFTVTV